MNRSAFVRSLARADLFVDAMFGTGFRGELTGDAQWIARRRRRVRSRNARSRHPFRRRRRDRRGRRRRRARGCHRVLRGVETGTLVRAGPLACRARLGGRHRHRDRAGGDRRARARGARAEGSPAAAARGVHAQVVDRVARRRRVDRDDGSAADVGSRRRRAPAPAWSCARYRARPPRPGRRGARS